VWRSRSSLRYIAASTAAMLYAFSPLTWQYAVTAEVRPPSAIKQGVCIHQQVIRCADLADVCYTAAMLHAFSPLTWQYAVTAEVRRPSSVIGAQPFVYTTKSLAGLG
jgi:hypothetical protein